MSPVTQSRVADPTSAKDMNPDITGSATGLTLPFIHDDPSRSAAQQAGTQSGFPAQGSKPKSKKKKSPVTVTMATAATAQAGSQGSHGENTGRWTAEEHRLFLQGLEQHGKGWKKIASLIKSRTVVQIRTHAQKYFQKLAKARQNGEEGDVAMEGRGGTASLPSVSAGAQCKRRRQTSGTKRKAIQSVVSSAQRQSKKNGSHRSVVGASTMVAPALSPYVLPPLDSEMGGAAPVAHYVTPSHSASSGQALEESLFRFLTPVPVASSEPQVNEVARQAGAHPITLPSDQHFTSHSIACGEVSPTGVADFSIYPSWTDAKDTPSWYAKGSDVDALLDVADTLDWLTDTGDLQESYQPAINSMQKSTSGDANEKSNQSLTRHPSGHDLSMSSFARVDSTLDVVVPPLPSLFDGATDTEDQPSKSGELDHITTSASSENIDEHLQVFDTPLEEHDFVSTILENHGESSNSLSALG